MEQLAQSEDGQTKELADISFLFDAVERPTYQGTAVPSPESIAQYYRELDEIRARRLGAEIAALDLFCD